VFTGEPGVKVMIPAILPSGGPFSFQPKKTNNSDAKRITPRAAVLFRIFLLEKTKAIAIKCFF